MACGGRPSSSSPRKRTEPPEARRRPITASMVVVLPAPLRPSRQTSSPCPTESDTPRRIGLPAISTRRPPISSINARAFAVRAPTRAAVASASAKKSRTGLSASTSPPRRPTTRLA